MIHEDVLYLLLPGLVQGGLREFRDHRNLCRVRVLDRFTLELQADFPAGLVRFDVELEPHLFDYATLYNQLSEYPSGRYIDIGPLDLAFTPPPHMALPLLAVAVDGALFGKMWFEMPSLDDLAQRKLGGVFALDFPAGGRHLVRISVDDADRGRLNLAQLERITVRRDNRRLAELPFRRGHPPRRPWLFLHAHRVGELQRWRHTTHVAVWTRMEQTVTAWLRTGECPVRGLPVLGTLAFLALVDEVTYLPKLVDLLEQRRRDAHFLVYPGKFMFFEPGVRLFAEENRWVMGYGWNDYGFSFLLLDYCCVYQWLGERLPTATRDWVREHLLHFGRALYRFGLFQRQYAGGQGFYESHEMVPCTAVAALGSTFWHELPDEAPRWLAFAFGRLAEALDVTPEDGKAEFLCWGPTWLAQTVELWRELTGRDERGRPYFRQLATALWRHRAGLVPGDYFGMLLTAYTASGLGDPAGRWHYQACHSAWEQGAPERQFASYLSFLWHSTTPGTDPGAVKDAHWLFADTGTAFLQTAFAAPRLFLRLQCGPSLGHAASYRLESYPGAQSTGTFAYGGFDVKVNGRPLLLDSANASYRRGFSNSNAVCVDGDGFYLEHLYLIGRTEQSRHAFIRRHEFTAEFAYVDGLNTPAYRSELRMVRSRRQWFFDVRGEWALILDDVESEELHNYRLHLHGPTAEPGTGGQCVFTDGAERLHAIILSDRPVVHHVEPPNLVLSYTANVTQVKGGGKLTADGLLREGKAPQLQRFVTRPADGCRAVRFLTVLSLTPAAAAWRDEHIRIRVPAGERRFRLKPDGALDFS